MEWQPIETAPLKTPVIIAARDGFVGEAQVYVVSEVSKQPRDNLGDRRAISARPNGDERGYCVPTHWMPLPTHPET